MSDNATPRTALIAYGSETGNAHEVADELGHLAERLHFTTQVSELNAVQPESLSTFSFVIFVVSTTGQGDIPLNARTFWKTLLLKKLPPTFLQGVQFTLFGLGDSSYPKFNWAAKKLRKRLFQLGANEIYNAGEADQQHPEGLEGTFLPWVTDLRKHLLDRYPLPPGLQPIPEDVQLPPKWVLEETSETTPPEQDKESPVTTSLLEPGEAPELYRLENDTRPIPKTVTATLTQNKRLTPASHWQDVRHICLTTTETIPYSPGDMVSILPKNFANDVDLLLRLMDWVDVADRPIRIVHAPQRDDNNNNKSTARIPPAPIPYLADTGSPSPSSSSSSSSKTPPLTLRTLLTEYLDIRAIPRRSFFARVAHYTTDSMHRERLLEFTNPEYIDELWDYTTRPRRSIIEVLQEFDTVQIPWQHALNVFPILRPRQFSIASGGMLKRTAPDKKKAAEGSRFELLVAIVRYQTVIKRLREGVCTRYLSALRPGSKLRIEVQRGGLNPSLPQLVGPTLLIGPGTGLAPLRAMIWEKHGLLQAYRAKHPEAPPPAMAPTILVFGNRNRDADYFFAEEWESLTSSTGDHSGINLTVWTAFSRDQTQKVYVQNRIRENAETVVRLLKDQGGSVFICGSSGRMPQAVREALIECFQKHAAASDPAAAREEAEKYLVEMEKSGRYKQETW